MYAPQGPRRQEDWLRILGALREGRVQWEPGKKRAYWGARTTDCSPELTNAVFPRRRASPWSPWAEAGRRLGLGLASSGGSRGAEPG